VSDGRRRIVLGEDDFDEIPDPATAGVPQPATPKPLDSAPTTSALPPIARRPTMAISNIGAPPAAARPSGSANWLYDPKLSALLAAAVGTVAGWGLAEILVTPIADRATSEAASNAYTGLWTGLVGAVFTAIVVGFDRAVAGAWGEAVKRAARTLIPGFAIAFVAGFVANLVFIELIKLLIKHGGLSSFGDLRLYVTRALGWAIFGCGVGVTVGLIDRSRAKGINGAIGGALGGAVGGLGFHYASLHFNSPGPSRLLGLLAVGLLIAVGTRAVESVRRDAWLTVVAGGMAGKEFVLYHPVTRIGSSPGCEIYLLKDPAVEPLHAQIEDRGATRMLTASPAAPVSVNGSSTTGHRLRSGDVVTIGSTAIAYSERAPALAAAGRIDA
jgi:hypothetical protein